MVIPKFLACICFVSVTSHGTNPNYSKGTSPNYSWADKCWPVVTPRFLACICFISGTNHGTSPNYSKETSPNYSWADKCWSVVIPKFLACICFVSGTNPNSAIEGLAVYYLYKSKYHTIIIHRPRSHCLAYARFGFLHASTTTTIITTLSPQWCWWCWSHFCSAKLDLLKTCCPHKTCCP